VKVYVSHAAFTGFALAAPVFAVDAVVVPPPDPLSSEPQPVATIAASAAHREYLIELSSSDNASSSGDDPLSLEGPY
jgi:hypothetical protein